MNVQAEIIQKSAAVPENRSAENARRLFDQAARDYENRRLARQRAESAYQTERERLVDGFRIELEELQHRARETLRLFDEDHAERMRYEDRVIAALDRLRQG